MLQEKLLYIQQKRGDMVRIGQGFDVHRLIPESELILGGERIPFGKGLEGHSDADVLVHAIMDALLGALALGDIGTWFPDTDFSYHNADSIGLLKKILEDQRLNGWKLGNLDCTIIAQEPKLAKFIPSMRKKLSVTFKTSTDNISIKATTTENLGFCGRGEGIAAMAILILTEDDTETR